MKEKDFQKAHKLLEELDHLIEMYDDIAETKLLSFIKISTDRRSNTATHNMIGKYTTKSAIEQINEKYKHSVLGLLAEKKQTIINQLKELE